MRVLPRNCQRTYPDGTDFCLRDELFYFAA